MEDDTMTAEESLTKLREGNKKYLTALKSDGDISPQLIREAFAEHPELQTMETVGAVYDVETGKVDWLS